MTRKKCDHKSISKFKMKNPDNLWEFVCAKCQHKGVVQEDLFLFGAASCRCCNCPNREGCSKEIPPASMNCPSGVSSQYWSKNVIIRFGTIEVVEEIYQDTEAKSESNEQKPTEDEKT